MNWVNMQTCASCREFPLATSIKTQGRGQCGAYERPAAWNDGSCVLYMPASNLDERRRMVEQLRAQPPITQEGINE